MDPERLLDGLNDMQRRAVTSTAQPLTILAGAGSGKTRVLTRRIAYRAATGDADPRRVLALTFTRKAAGELRSRLHQLGLRDEVAAGTFHSVAFAQLRGRWADRDITPPSLLDRKVGFVARLLPPALARDGSALDVVTEIEWAKARRVEPDGYADAARVARRTPPVDAGQIARLFERYEEEKRRRRLVDFDDLLRLCHRDLTRDDDFAAAQRWRFRHLFVDEFQDVNPLQHALLRAWQGDRRDVTVVGDPNQAIYAWNGADNRYLLDLAAGKGGGEVIRLQDNYRSSPQILAVANAVLADSWSARKAAEQGDELAALKVAALRPNRPDGPLPTVVECDDERAEARAVARAVRDARQPRAPWSAQAVLVRTNAQTTLLEEALRAAGIPYRVRGGAALLDQPEVKRALADLRSGAPDFDVALVDLQAAADRYRTEHEQAADASGALPGLGDTDDEEDGDPFAAGSAPAVDERRANLLELVRLAGEYGVLESAPTVPGFLGWLAETTRADQPDRVGDAVELVTFHAAKGLEWPIVHLAGLEQGLVPIGHAQTPAELAEERRLFYVAVTRAERELHCTWARTRTFGRRTVDRQPSGYLRPVEAAVAALRAGAVPDDWARFFAAGGGADQLGGDGRDQARSRPARGARTGRTKPGAARAEGALADLSADDQALFEALREWRATVAKAAAVPAYTVFHDATLQDIARARPADDRQLAAIKGLGPTKVNRWGPAILELVRDHADAG